MKTNHPTHQFVLPATAVALLAFAGLSAPFAKAQSANDRVRIEVRVQTDSDRKDIKGSSADTVTQRKSLFIAISGKPKSPETRTGKWTVYGRDMKGGRDIAVLESGEFKIELPASGQQKVESKVVSATYTPEHSVVSRSGSGSRSRSTAKKTPGEGNKYAGYGVVIKDGDQIVGEMFDPMGIKQEAAK